MSLQRPPLPAMRSTLLGLAILLALGLPHPAGATTTESWRYVAGTGLDGIGLFCGATANQLGAPDAGGYCAVPAHGPEVTLSVVDDLQGPVSFYYVGYAETGGVSTGTSCPLHGYAASPATLAIPEGCDGLHVFPAVGSLAGTITATS